MSRSNDVRTHLLSILKGEDLLLVVPPFVTGRTPILGPHILHTIARLQGYKVDILYLNLLLASIIGMDLYENICYGQPFQMLGERLFARSAHGLPPLGKFPDLCEYPGKSVFGYGYKEPLEEFEYKYYKTTAFNIDTFLKSEALCQSFIEDVSQTIASLDYKIVGCSSNWEQNNCCIALLKRLKKLRPETLTLMGGSNCEGDMAEGIASLSDAIDYIFAGESESTFAHFLTDFNSGVLPAGRIIEGFPVEDPDDIPLPDFASYFEQIDGFFADNPPQGIAIGYETSRGCWYGQCHFCGMNGKRKQFRQKTVKKVAAELGKLKDRFPGRGFLFIDKLMPPAYQEELLPLLVEKNGSSPITCEHRPGPGLNELLNLKKAGFNIIKFGIETLSTGLLLQMNKGITAADNILLLRNAAVSGIYVDWNLLWGFPGDKVEHYREILRLIPLLRHLCPPGVFRHVSLDRFSAYVDRPRDFKITHLRPWAAYRAVYPEWADVDKLAYRFIGDYPCDAHDHPDLIQDIAGVVESWKNSWKHSRLVMIPFSDYYIIYDTRGIDGKNKNHILDEDQANEIMISGNYTESEYQKWAVEEKLAVIADSKFIPLVTASPELLAELDT
jgi:ribosomal peptide maturation radical SAM protein 1